jgi:hypothetical protein
MLITFDEQLIQGPPSRDATVWEVGGLQCVQIPQAKSV